MSEDGSVGTEPELLFLTFNREKGLNMTGYLGALLQIYLQT